MIVCRSSSDFCSSFEMLLAAVDKICNTEQNCDGRRARYFQCWSNLCNIKENNFNVGCMHSSFLYMTSSNNICSSHNHMNWKIIKIIIKSQFHIFIYILVYIYLCVDMYIPIILYTFIQIHIDMLHTSINAHIYIHCMYMPCT